MMPDSARRKTPVPALARWPIGLGAAATLVANVAHGLGHGLIGDGDPRFPVDITGRTRLVIEQLRYWSISWQPIAFLQSARSSTWARLGRSGCGATSLQKLQGRWKVPLHVHLHWRTSSHGRCSRAIRAAPRGGFPQARPSRQRAW
jgi:hypothetical protein